MPHEARPKCRRALDLVYALVNENNIKSLTKELLEYLKISDTEFKPDLTAKICQLVLRFAPDKRWHFDSILQVTPLTTLPPPPHHDEFAYNAQRAIRGSLILPFIAIQPKK